MLIQNWLLKQVPASSGGSGGSGGSAGLPPRVPAQRLNIVGPKSTAMASSESAVKIESFLGLRRTSGSDRDGQASIPARVISKPPEIVVAKPSSLHAVTKQPRKREVHANASSEAKNKGEGGGEGARGQGRGRRQARADASAHSAEKPNGSDHDDGTAADRGDRSMLAATATATATATTTALSSPARTRRSSLTTSQTLETDAFASGTQPERDADADADDKAAPTRKRRALASSDISKPYITTSYALARMMTQLPVELSAQRKEVVKVQPYLSADLRRQGPSAVADADSMDSDFARASKTLLRAQTSRQAYRLEAARHKRELEHKIRQRQPQLCSILASRGMSSGGVHGGDGSVMGSTHQRNPFSTIITTPDGQRMRHTITLRQVHASTSDDHHSVDARACAFKSTGARGHAGENDDGDSDDDDDDDDDDMSGDENENESGDDERKNTRTASSVRVKNPSFATFLDMAHESVKKAMAAMNRESKIEERAAREDVWALMRDSTFQAHFATNMAQLLCQQQTEHTSQTKDSQSQSQSQSQSHRTDSIEHAQSTQASAAPTTSANASRMHVVVQTTKLPPAADSVAYSSTSSHSSGEETVGRVPDSRTKPPSITSYYHSSLVQRR